jgi:hypothetical protein
MVLGSLVSKMLLNSDSRLERPSDKEETSPLKAASLSV